MKKDYNIPKIEIIYFDFDLQMSDSTTKDPDSPIVTPDDEF